MKSIYLLDYTNQTLAEILFIDNELAILMPTWGGFELAKNAASPFGIFTGPVRGTKEYFLNLFASIASLKTEYPYSVQRYNKTYIHELLTRNMNAQALANLMDMDVEEVRTFLKNHLTFEEETEK